MSIFPYSSHQRTYVRATKTGQHQLAVRTKSPKGQWPAGVLLFAGLDHKDILTLMGLPRLTDETSIILAMLTSMTNGEVLAVIYQVHYFFPSYHGKRILGIEPFERPLTCSLLQT